MKRAKKAIAAILAIVMIVGSFSGCSASGGKSSTAAVQKEVTITWPCIWVGTDAKAAIIKTLVDDFNTKNTGKIKVVIEEQTDYQAYRDKLRTDISANNTPDIFTFDTDVETYLKSGKTVDLTSALKTDNWSSNFIDGALELATSDNQINAIPFEMSCTPVMYNKKLLAKVGYSSFPKTYDELWTLCDKLKAANITPMSQMTGENAWTSMLWYSQALLAIGGKDVYKNNNEDDFVKAADVVKKMFAYTTKDAVGAKAAVSGGHFLAGETAIFMNGPWYISTIKKNGTDSLYDNVGIAPAPSYTGGKGTYGGYVGGVQAYICVGKTTSEKQAAAITFLKYLTDPINTAKIAQASNSLFYVKISSDTITEKLQSEISKEVSAAPYVVGNFQNQSQTAVANEFPQALSSLVLGSSTSKQFVDDLNSKKE
jgi:ABC-type glycerol-3-phosphate transport system substrate-binding protein